MKKLASHKWFQLSFPFAIYMLFVLIQELIGKTIGQEIAINLTPFIYPVKIFFVTTALAVFWKHYRELHVANFQKLHVLASIGIGALVFVLWIHMDWDFATVESPASFNPGILTGVWLPFFLGVRLLGAAFVVPVFEELFWRSFVLRYIINPDFAKVQIGTFSWSSFAIASILFGLEHHLWFAGIVAGMLYNLLLYYTRQLFYCILAHGTTNLLLGIYVIKTGSWQFW